jgi:4-hydroxy-2-oxoheptanedioate aldolase
MTKGEISIGMLVQTGSPIVVELMGYAGMDFVIIDNEHAASDEIATEAMIRAAEVSGMVPIVRVPYINPKRIMKTLDSGAQGVMIPHLKSKEEAELFVNCTKYREQEFPKGIRGATPGMRAAKYHEWDGYWQSANRNIMTIGIIEDKEGADNVEQIASVSHLDAIVPGPFDLSVSLGYSGDYTNPRVQEEMERIMSACQRHSKPVIGLAWDLQSAKDLIRNSVTTLIFDEDVSLLYNACRKIVESVNIELRGQKRAQ